jgi:hypothetical protein
MTINDFLLALRRAVSVYTNKISNTETPTQEERRLNILYLNYAIIYYDILEFYYTSTGITGDINILTDEDILIVLDKFNIITEEYLQLP